MSVKKYTKEHRLYSDYVLHRKRAKKAGRRKIRELERHHSIYRTVNAPVELCLYHKSNHRKTCDFFDRLLTLSRKERVQIDFSKCDRIAAPVALLLYSVIEQTQQSDAHHPIRFLRSSIEQGLVKALKSSGLWQLSLMQEVKSTDSLPIVSANCSKESSDKWEEVLDYIGQEVMENGFTPEEENRFGAAVSEAVTNVLDHAYPDLKDLKRFADMQWWMICEVVNDELYLAIMDRGVGIPKTLPKKSWFRDAMKATPEVLSKLVDRNSDAEWIKASLRKGETATQQRERGLGGPTILDLVEKNKTGTLWIFSNSGIYCRLGGEVYSAKDSHNSINGTIVQWNIRLRDEHRD
ncbi:hypothetical protein [Endozoicomonas sp. ISHI1]|uniref:ATP-binding protein n=1 Tax=Endozoicomonas sp. ISHI1 TaxID=2825882 RepID=UPI0021476718|nr:hypothetical protein [Endozoicomonas sp. ISHI1]